jgi:hypothetical protein
VFTIHIGVSAGELMDIVWTAVRQLMEINLKVVVVISDGISSNRIF